MPLYESDAFVLRTYNLGESDQIVVLFTRDFGKLRAVARRSRHPRRHTASYYQPLMLLHAILFGRASQPLYRINTVDIVDAFRVLREDFGYLRCGLYLTELIDLTTREHEPVADLFRLFHLTLEQLSQVSHSAMLLRWFELRLLTAIGYTPQLFYCARCAAEVPSRDGAFDAHLGGLLCVRCAPKARQTLRISQATLEFLRLAMTHDAGDWPCLGADAEQELEHVLHAHLTARLGRELKSYAFLHL